MSTSHSHSQPDPDSSSITSINSDTTPSERSISIISTWTLTSANSSRSSLDPLDAAANPPGPNTITQAQVDVLNDLVDRLQDICAAFRRSVEEMAAAADRFGADAEWEAFVEGMEGRDFVGGSYVEIVVGEGVREGGRAVGFDEGTVVGRTATVAEGGWEGLAQGEESTAWIGGVGGGACWEVLDWGEGAG